MTTDRRENEPAPESIEGEDPECRSCRKEAAEIVRRIIAERRRIEDLRRRVQEREEEAGATRGWTRLGKLLDLVEGTWLGGP